MVSLGRFDLPFLNLLNHVFIAFATCVFQLTSVFNFYRTALIGNDSCFLKMASCYCNAYTACRSNVQNVLRR